MDGTLMLALTTGGIVGAMVGAAVVVVVRGTRGAPAPASHAPTSENRTTENRTTENRATENRSAENRSAENRSADEEATARVDAMIRAGLDALQAGVLVVDGADRPVFANPAARDMGLAVLHPDSGLQAHPIIRTLVGQARRDGSTRVVELDLPRTTAVAGGLEPLGVHVRAVALGNGQVAVEAADVTESHRLARVRRDFVANVSHELKTPVGALQLLAEALLEATADPANPDRDPAEPDGDPAAARRFAERIRHEAARLGRLVSELLELSRIQGAEPLPEPAPVSVDRVVAEVVDRARTPASVKRIELAITGMRGLTVYGNESQLVTALVNLVENAIAYSGDSTCVTVGIRGDAELIEIAVVDQGIGIEPRDIDRIFERFYRADRARSRATGGTGLGLAIVKHIATNHGGRVDVTSTVGVGSTFTLRLPARLADASSGPPASTEISDGDLCVVPDSTKVNIP